MANKLELIAKIILDGKAAEQSVGQLRKKIEDARIEQQKLSAEFGETSSQALLAAEKVKLLEDSLKFAVDPIGAINDELEFTKQQLEDVTAQFGETSPEAQALIDKINILESSIEGLKDPVAFFTSELANAEAQLQSVVETFGEASPEARAAAEEVANIKKQLNEVKGIPIDEPVKSLKSQLKDARNELNLAIETFGELSDEAARAASKVADIEDKIGDAKKLTDAFNPDAKFKAFGNAIQGAAGAFAALQGAQALFGKESEDVQKALLKVQGALALSQGLNSIIESKDAFVALGAQIKQTTIFKNLDNAATKTAAAVQTLFTGAVNAGSVAFKGLKVAIAATGIGALVVALGTIIAYWDDIKEAFSGLSAQQVKLNEEGQKNLEQQQKKLEAIDGQEEILKAQGKTEKEILQIKALQTDEAIKAAEVNLENAKQTKNAQVEAAKRNKEFLKGALDFVSIPLTLLLRSIDAIGKALGKDFGLTEGFKENVANLIFDPEEVAKEGDKAVNEAQAALDKLKNQRAGFQNQIKAIDKQAADDAAKKAEENNKKAEELAKQRAEFDKQTEELIAQNRINAIKDAGQKALAQIQSDYDKELAALRNLLNTKQITLEQFQQREAALLVKANAQRTEVQNSIDERIIANAKKVEDIIQQTRLDALEEGFIKRQVLLEQEYQDEIDAALDALNKGQLNETEYQNLRLAIDAQFAQKRSQLKKSEAEKNLEDRTAELEATIADENQTFARRFEAINQEELLLEQARANGLIKEEAYNAKIKDLANKRVQTQVAEKEARAKIIGQISDLAVGAVKVLAGAFEKNKGLQIASILIEQAASVAKIISNTQAANAAVTAKYALIPGGAALAAVEKTFNRISAGIGIATSIAAAVKGIQQIKNANAQGGGNTSGAANVGGENQGGAAPIPPQPETTALPQEQINQLSTANAAVRSYVIESDVTTNQERIVRINRAARIN